MQAKYDNIGINRLKEWLKGNDLSLQAFCTEHKLNYRQVWDWLHGLRIPTVEKAVQIEEITNGYTTCAHWVKKPISLKLGHKNNQGKKSNKKSNEKKRNP